MSDSSQQADDSSDAGVNAYYRLDNHPRARSVDMAVHSHRLSYHEAEIMYGSSTEEDVRSQGASYRRRPHSRVAGGSMGTPIMTRRPLLRARSCHVIAAFHSGSAHLQEFPVEAGTQHEAEGEEDDSLDQPVTICNAPKQHKMILLCLAMADFLAFMGFSLLAPFFPVEAERRGISTTMSGWVFGVFSLVQFVSSPFIGKILPKVGAKFTFICGGFICGVCTILFGFLDMFPYKDGSMLFICFCFGIRIVMALGATAWATSSFTIATYTFSDNPATVMGFLETAVGLGLMAGPALGGILYDLGGFRLPFLAVGCFTLSILPIFMFTLEADITNEDDNGDPGSIIRLLRVPAISTVCLGVFTSALMWIVLDPVLEPHLRQVYNLDATRVGLVFLLLSGVYGVIAPITGFMADKIEDSIPMMIVGFMILAGCFLTLGPSPLLGLGDFDGLWLVLVSLAVMGVGMSLAVVPTFDKIIYTAEKAGIEESLGMHGAVAGMWNSVYALGETVGPVMSGALTEKHSFAFTMTVCAVIAVFMIVVLTILWFCENCLSCCKYPSQEQHENDDDTESDDDEKRPLLSNPQLR